MEAMNSNHNLYDRPASIILAKDLPLEPLIDLKWHFESLVPNSTALQQKQIVLRPSSRIHGSDLRQKFLKKLYLTPQYSTEEDRGLIMSTSENTASSMITPSEDSENSSPATSFQGISDAFAFGIDELHGVFTTFDETGDGKLSIDEIRESMAKLGFKVTEKQLTSMMAAIDDNGSGFVDVEEFLSLFLMKDQGLGNIEDHDEKNLKRAFAVFDKDEDGYITAHELQTVISILVGVSSDNKIVDCRNMIRGADMDGDGKINFLEFKLMMSNQSRFMLCPSAIKV